MRILKLLVCCALDLRVTNAMVLFTTNVSRNASRKRHSGHFELSEHPGAPIDPPPDRNNIQSHLPYFEVNLVPRIEEGRSGEVIAMWTVSRYYHVLDS